MAEKRIGGREFKIEGGNAEEAYHLFFRLMKCAGPFVSAIGHTDTREKDEGEVDFTQGFFDSLGMALSNLSPRDWTDIIRDLCQLAVVRRPSGRYEQVYFGEDFKGKYEEAYQVAMWVAEEEYSGLFREALAVVMAQMTARALQNNR